MVACFVLAKLVPQASSQAGTCPFPEYGYGTDSYIRSYYGYGERSTECGEYHIVCMREREFYFTPARPGCEHMAATPNVACRPVNV